MTSFRDLGLIEPLQRAVREAGYTHPTPIQTQAIPHLLEGHDLLGCARTGTGKTAAFALPMLQLLSERGRGPEPKSAHRRDARSAHGPDRHPPTRSVRALVLVPTRELAAQVGLSFEVYGRNLKLSVAVVYGGVGQERQVRALSRGVDVLVATPGRLLDLMGQRHARLDRLEILVLDEADHMLDLGFIPDVRRILTAVPQKRQTLFFSATMPPAIAGLADRILTRPVRIEVSPQSSTVDEVEQRVHFVSTAGKAPLLVHLLGDPDVERALVFTRTKRGADRLAKRLIQDGIAAEAIHGNKSQGARERTLGGFRGGRVRVLIATDIAARGIDVDGVTHVVNYDLPDVPESYVHRIGRTARAGASGVAIALCDAEERASLRDIERLIGRKLAVIEHPKSALPASRAPERASRSHSVRETASVHRGTARREHGSGPKRNGTARRSKRRRGRR